MADGAGNEPDGPEAVIIAWCKGCKHATASVTCEKCAVPKGRVRELRPVPVLRRAGPGG